MELAFKAGYDPALEVAIQAKKRYGEDDHKELHLRRKEQDIVDRIVSGEEVGRYFMLIGSKVRRASVYVIIYCLVLTELGRVRERQR